MDQRESLVNSDPDGRSSPFGWRALAVAMSIVVWMAFGPLGPSWLYFLIWALALAAAGAISWLARRRGWAWASRPPSPGRLVGALLGLGLKSRLLDPRWTRVRVAAIGFLLFATIAGGMGWNAAQDYQMLAELRDHGRRTNATVVEIASRSEEDRATALTVRFSTPSGPVRTDVDVAGSSATDVEPGAQIPVVYDRAVPAEVIHVEYLDGRVADGIRRGSIVIGLLAAGFLVGATREVVRAERQRDEGKTPDVRHPKP